MERRKFVIGLGSLAAGGAAATGTGAFTAAEVEGRQASIDVVDDSYGLVGLEPGSTELVSDNGSGELVIYFDTGSAGGNGVNSDSTYQVGGLDEFDENIENVPGAPTADPSLGDLAIDTDTSITQEYAFKVMNQTNSSKAIELEYAPSANQFPDGSYVYLAAYYPNASTTPQEEEGLAIGDVSNDSEKAASIIFDDQQYSTPIGSGDEFYVTLLVKVSDDSTTNLGGDISVLAGSHDDFSENATSTSQ